MLYSCDFHYSKFREESALLQTCKNAQWSVFRWLSLDRSKMSNDCEFDKFDKICQFCQIWQIFVNFFNFLSNLTKFRGKIQRSRKPVKTANVLFYWLTRGPSRGTLGVPRGTLGYLQGYLGRGFRRRASPRACAVVTHFAPIYVLSIQRLIDKFSFKKLEQHALHFPALD